MDGKVNQALENSDPIHYMDGESSSTSSGSSVHVYAVSEIGEDVIPVPATQEVVHKPDYRGLIHHDFWGLKIWDYFIGIAALYSAFTIPYAIVPMENACIMELRNQAGGTKNGNSSITVFEITDAIIVIIFWIDIFFNFRRTYINHDSILVTSKERIALHYALTWFLVDLIAAFPIDLLYFVVNHGTPDACSNVIGKIGRILKILHCTGRIKSDVSQWISFVIQIMYAAFFGNLWSCWVHAEFAGKVTHVQTFGYLSFLPVNPMDSYLRNT